MNLNGTFDGLAKWLGNLFGNQVLACVVLAGIIAIITCFVCGVFTKLIRKLSEKRGSTLPITIFVNLTRVVIWSIGLCIMFPVCFNINLTAIIAALGIGGVALSLGLQDTISNIIGGLQLSILNTIKIGDYVVYDGQDGVVEDIAWRQTTIRGLGGDEIVVPNSLINSTSIQIMPSVRELWMKIHVPYETVALCEKDGGLDELAAQLKQAATARLTAQAPEGLGLELERECRVLFRQSGEYTVTATLIAVIAECEEFKRTAAEDAIMRACVPIATKGYSNAG